MRTRTLGKNGPEITVLGLGTWAIGGPWEFGWGPVDDNESVKAIHRALDLGINWIDTAAVYGLGHSEEVIARALKGNRHQVFLATKCGMVWDDQQAVKRNLKPESIRREIEGSLRRLRTDYIDLYQIHWPDPETPLEASWKALVDLVGEGKVRYLGVCNFSVSDLEQAHLISPVQSLQPPYNMLKRDIEKELLPFCAKNDIGVVAYSPMASGLLSGGFDFEKLADDDWRRKSPRFNAENRAKVDRLLQSLKPIAKQHGVTIGQLAVAWILKNDNVTSAIVGARNVWQLDEIVLAAETVLTEEEMNLIGSVL